MELATPDLLDLPGRQRLDPFLHQRANPQDVGCIDAIISSQRIVQGAGERKS
jgi:hypothetical protein